MYVHKHVARTYRSGKGSFLLSIKYYCKSYVHEDSFVILVMHGQYSTIYSVVILGHGVRRSCTDTVS